MIAADPKTLAAALVRAMIKARDEPSSEYPECNAWIDAANPSNACLDGWFNLERVAALAIEELNQ